MARKKRGTGLVGVTSRRDLDPRPDARQKVWARRGREPRQRHEAPGKRLVCQQSGVTCEKRSRMITEVVVGSSSTKKMVARLISPSGNADAGKGRGDRHPSRRGSGKTDVWG